MASVHSDPNYLRNERRQFYVVVHTQTDAQVGHYVCGGGLDLGLNEDGKEEARKLARRFKRNPLKIKRMIASPELRCIQMADIIHDEMKAKLTLAREFFDQYMGEYEGKPIHSDMDFAHPPKGETAQVFSVRVNMGLDKFLVEKDSALFVVHARVAAEILARAGLTGETMEPGKMYVIDLPAAQGRGHLREV
jgi:broad specificity phosphatase PhoE